MRGAPLGVERLLQQEERDHGDVLRVDVHWNETRLRGPVLSVAAWLSYAVRTHSARCVAKLDDDAYVYAPALEGIVLQALAVAPHPDTLYMGPISWFHWYERIYERSGFGWTYTMAWHLGRSCRNVTEAEKRCRQRGCGSCVGPFPFTSGYLSILATPLAAELVRTAPLVDDVPRLAATDALPTRTGGAQFKVMEDIWLGSLLYRRPPSRPLTYVALSEKDDTTLVSDGWGLKATKSSVVVHVKNHLTGKQLERFLAIDAFKRDAYCAERYDVRCAVGCSAFFSSGENASMHMMPKFASTWMPRLEQSTLCQGSQREAAFCRIGAHRPRLCNPKPKDLLKDGFYLRQTEPRARQLLSSLRAARAAALPRVRGAT